MDRAAPPRPPRRYRTARVIAAVMVWMVMGAALTVLSTWGGLITEAFFGVRPADQAAELEWSHAVDPAWRWAPDVFYSTHSNWSDWTFYYLVLSHGDVFPTDHRAGWPYRCLCGWTAAGRLSYEWHIPGAPTLPLFPLWPGFALNTLFYAAIAWVLWRIPILIRRHRRRIRGLCLRCAYNRAGLAPGAPCPECGHPPLPSSSVTSS